MPVESLSVKSLIAISKKTLTIPRLWLGFRRKIINWELYIMPFLDAAFGLRFHEPILATWWRRIAGCSFGGNWSVILLGRFLRLLGCTVPSDVNGETIPICLGRKTRLEWYLITWWEWNGSNLTGAKSKPEILPSSNVDSTYRDILLIVSCVVDFTCSLLRLFHIFLPLFQRYSWLYFFLWGMCLYSATRTPRLICWTSIP
jgi:hypothetical protein